MINGMLCTIIWHADNLKISHLDEIVMEHIIKSWTEYLAKKAHSWQQVVKYMKSSIKAELLAIDDRMDQVL